MALPTFFQKYFICLKFRQHCIWNKQPIYRPSMMFKACFAVNHDGGQFHKSLLGIHRYTLGLWVEIYYAVIFNEILVINETLNVKFLVSIQMDSLLPFNVSK